MKLHSIVRKTLQVLLMPVLLTWGGAAICAAAGLRTGD